MSLLYEKELISKRCPRTRDHATAHRNPFKLLPPEAKARLRKIAQPAWVAPMLATLTKERFSRPGWLFEPKWDGERCLCEDSLEPFDVAQGERMSTQFLMRPNPFVVSQPVLSRVEGNHERRLHTV